MYYSINNLRDMLQGFTMIKRITAQELTQKLESDPEWVARRDKRNVEVQSKRARILLEQHPVLKDLQAVGINYESLDDMLHSSYPYPAAVPVLLKHLQLMYSDSLRALIARCLATKEAVFAWDFLVDAYSKEPLVREDRDSKTKDGLAAAISATVTSSRIEDLIMLVSNPHHGPSRVLLLKPLRVRAKNICIKQVLREFMSDRDLEKEIRSWKKICKSKLFLIVIKIHGTAVERKSTCYYTLMLSYKAKRPS